MDSPEGLNIPEARQAIASGALDPLDLVEACLRRIEKTEPELQAWLTIDEEGALAQARSAAGRRDRPLGGIPLAIKDIIDVAGLPTTAASKILAGNVARSDAAVVERLRSAGAIVLGKTNTQEFAYGFSTPPTVNPWDPSRIPGGSSGGSAAAVAASQCLGALGTDTGGSIRVPSALCGVCGLKPRQGAVPVDGVIPLAPSLDVVGPIAATVEDLVPMWQAISGRATRLDDRRPRIAAPGAESLPPLDEDVERAYRDALEVLASFASSRIEVAMPSFEAFDLPRAAILMPQALEVHRSRGWWPARAAEYTEETRGYLSFAEGFFTPEMMAAGLAESRRLTALFISTLDEADVLVTPTVPCGAPTHEEAALKEEGSPRRPMALTLGRLTGPVNMAGLAALSVPCGFTSEGLPIGLQLIARDEETVLALGLRYEKESGRVFRRPPLA